MATDPLGSKKLVFHSGLRSASEPNGLWMMRTSASHDSKFKGKPPYVDIVAADEEGQPAATHQLQIENAQVRAHLDSLTEGVWYLVRALGDRESATLAVQDQEGNEVEAPEVAPAPAPPAAPAAAPATPAAAPAQKAKTPSRGSSTPEEPKAEPSLSRVMWEALVKAHLLVEHFEQEYGREPTDCERSIAISFAIEHRRCGGNVRL